MLALSPSVCYIPELFSPENISGLCRVPVRNFFQYINSCNEHLFLPTIRDALGLKYPLMANWTRASTGNERLRSLRRYIGYIVRRVLLRQRVLDKDPFALMSAEWLHKRFKMEIVILIRHPAAFAGSVKRLGWPGPFPALRAQEELLRTHLEPFAAEIRDSPADLIEQAILMWRIMYHLVDEYRRRWPEWIYIRHEDFCQHPPGSFEWLYDRLGLTYSDRIRSQIAAHSSASNPSEAPEGVVHQLWLHSARSIGSWKNRLTKDEISRIRKGTGDIYYSFYGDEDWA
jgi:hypothetical protein